MPGLKEPKTDHHLLRHMRLITEMLVSDGASSELLAADVCRGLQSRAEDAKDEAFTPNVKIVGRDLAHCARHVLRKPWQADPHIATLFDTTVWHKTSVVQIIDRSDVFRQWSQVHCAGQRHVEHTACFQPELCQAQLRVLQQTLEPVRVAPGGGLQDLPLRRLDQGLLI
jgi:hypothetical protein